jgi:hypothetical protein
MVRIMMIWVFFPYRYYLIMSLAEQLADMGFEQNQMYVWILSVAFYLFDVSVIAPLRQAKQQIWNKHLIGTNNP